MPKDTGMKKIDARLSSVSERPPPRVAKELILYVEDETENWDVTVLHLARKYDMHRAATAKDACAFVRAHHDLLFAILVDVQLKGSALNGVELVRLMRTPSSAADVPEYARDLPMISLPIFFVTAYSGSVPPGSGASGCIAKPVDFVKLMRALTSLHLKTLDAT